MYRCLHKCLHIISNQYQWNFLSPVTTLKIVKLAISLSSTNSLIRPHKDTYLALAQIDTQYIYICMYIFTVRLRKTDIRVRIYLVDTSKVIIRLTVKLLPESTNERLYMYIVHYMCSVCIYLLRKKRTCFIEEYRNSKVSASGVKLEPYTTMWHVRKATSVVRIPTIHRDVA